MRKSFKKWLAGSLMAVLVAGEALGMGSIDAMAAEAGTVNVLALNLRSGASTSTGIIGVLYKGTSVTIESTSGAWYKVTATVGGKSTSGYVYQQYITKGTQSGTQTGAAASSKSTGTVTAGALNVRSAASMSASIIGCISKGTQVTIQGTSSQWYQVSVVISGRTVHGYVSASYVKLNSSTGTTAGEIGTAVWVKTGRVNTAVLNFRKGPGTGYERIGYLYEGYTVTIIEETGGWYKVTAATNGKNLTGYVSAQYITVVSGSQNASGGQNSGQQGNSGQNTSENKNPSGSQETGGTSQSQQDFEKMISAFPDSYKQALRVLHEKHPNWVFKAVNTGLDWNDVVREENKFGKSTVEISSVNSQTNFGLLSTQTGAYDWSTDQYTVCDGRTWYAASEELVKYYLDPRNFLDEKYIFCFQSLAYEQNQKQSVVSSILNGSFMSGNYTETDPDTGKQTTRNYAQTFMEAGKLSGASPYFLAGRALGEVGYKGSNSVTGTYGIYSGYYNFYNIGAFDGTDAVANALKFAQKTNSKYNLPWNTRYKSITGGAKYIAENYINVGQNTPYFQKFNVVNHDGLYWHQYMTSIRGAASSAALVYNSFKNYGVLDEEIVFYIPVYKNMPASVCTMPQAGNPNPYLKTLQLNSGNVVLTPSFKYNVTEYTVVVPKSVSSVTVSASPVSSFAKGVSGTGTYSLTSGQTKVIQVTCTAGNGASQTYTIKIYRQ